MINSKDLNCWTICSGDWKVHTNISTKKEAEKIAKAYMHNKVLEYYTLRFYCNGQRLDKE